MGRNEDGLNVMFEKIYDEVVQQQGDIQLFIQLFDQKFNKYLDEKEEDLRNPVEMLINDFRVSAIKWKQQQYDKLRDNHKQDSGVGQMLVIGRELKEIVNRYEELVGETQELIKQKQEEQNRMIRKYFNDVNAVKRLRNCKEIVEIWNVDELEQNKQRIIGYERQQKQYRIEINFYIRNDSVDDKMKLIDVIDELNVNDKVGEIHIKLNQSIEKINRQIIKTMINRYHNVYSIGIYDQNDIVNNDIHEQIKQLVDQSTVLRFALLFHYGTQLFNNMEGIQLLKQYNQLIEQKQYLQWLGYCHKKIEKNSESIKEIQPMIDKVNSI